MSNTLNTDALRSYLQQTGWDTQSFEVQPLVGGQSNPTYKITCANQQIVLRKKPAGTLLPSAHAIDREYRVMQALEKTEVPVPNMLAYCDDASILGTPFYLMSFLDGRVFNDQSLPQLDRKDRLAIYQEMNQVLAAIHQVDYRALGLESFGKPGNYFARQVARWSRQVQESSIPIPTALSKLMEWLPHHIPTDDETTLVHGDFRLDNMVFDPIENKVIGVLDWELSTLGHPLADISYQCMAWRIPPTLWRGIGGLNLVDLGIPSEEEYIRSYEMHSGRSVGKDWNFYMAYNFFRISAILHGVAQRAVDGNAHAKDAAENGQKSGLLGEIGLSCVDLT
ncbi:phosphotransferase family protein [Polynucleobacter antarcticus]|uniref:Phosphotransferase family protein n=1 Tax=Polynucleobacter antarcticus TaxID=1743162 RepID=A0A6M9PP89_9BURK|nr:phosphotransferase family protein [Polynucleobacter antarcticus]QKM62221.1 phosphotransferase family protein [Polynucleobacter antarcticus]